VRLPLRIQICASACNAQTFSIAERPMRLSMEDPSGDRGSTTSTKGPHRVEIVGHMPAHLVNQHHLYWLRVFRSMMLPANR